MLSTTSTKKKPIMNKLRHLTLLLSPICFVSCVTQPQLNRGPEGLWQGEFQKSKLQLNVIPSGGIKLKSGSTVTKGSWIKHTPNKILISSSSTGGFQFKGNLKMKSDNLAVFTFNKYSVSMVRVITVQAPRPKRYSPPEPPRSKSYRLNTLE